MIWGRLLAYYSHCTHRADFLLAADKLLQRLIARGHCPRLTRRLINKRTEELCSQTPAAMPKTLATNTNDAREKARKLYFKIPYDPNGPDRLQLRRLLRLDHIERQLLLKTGTPISCRICYTTAPSLHQLLHFHHPSQCPSRPALPPAITHTTHIHTTQTHPPPAIT